MRKYLPIFTFIFAVLSPFCVNAQTLSSAYPASPEHGLAITAAEIPASSGNEALVFGIRAFFTFTSISEKPTVFSSTDGAVVPEPYGEDEFPEWLETLRRFEIITIGFFPFAIFYVGLSWDLYRYISNGFDSYYAPWPFKNEFSYQPTRDEIYITIGIAAGVSVLAGIVDLIIHSIIEAGENESPPPAEAPETGTEDA